MTAFQSAAFACTLAVRAGHEDLGGEAGHAEEATGDLRVVLEPVRDDEDNGAMKPP